MTTPAKLIMIGLDSCDLDLVATWSAAGELPNMTALLNDWIVGRVENPYAMESGAVWPTFHTGVNPARHRQYDANRVFDSEIYDHRVLRPDEMSPHYMWNHFNAHGKRLCLIDPVYTQMPQVADGIVVHDWGTHIPGGGGTILQFETDPPELAGEIERRFGLDTLGAKMCDTHQPRTAEQQAWFRDAMVERARRKGEMAAWLLGEGNTGAPWDFFYVAFTEQHCTGHHCWHMLDPTHPDYDAEIVAQVGNPMLDVYRAIDAAVGRILQVAGEQPMVFVYCSHGMGVEYTGTRMLDRLLVALQGRKLLNMRSPSVNRARAMWRALPTGVRDMLKPMQRKAWRAMMADGFQPNRRGRPYFEVYLNNRTSGVRINLKGRDSSGIVEPGAEYDRVVAELTDDLMAFTNAETGEPLITECLHLNKDLDGQHADDIPDLAVTWNNNAPIRRATSPKTGEVINEELTVRSGDHRPDGQFLARVPAARPRRLNEPVRAVDFVPTFYALLDMPIPDTDGRPIEAVVGQQRLSA